MSTDWARKAVRRLKAALRAAREQSGLRKAGPPAPRGAWTADLQLVSPQAMTRINRRYRGKAYATDVLSFPAPEPFRREGHLGELLICLSTLKRQAREQGHSPERELDVLLIHGVLHLLGFDHERGPAQAARMARWEARLLRGRPGSGLIARSKTGK